MRKSLVSLVALGLFIGAPALVDTAAAQTTTQQQSTQQQSTQQQSTQQQSGQQQTTALTAEHFEEMLAEYEARSEVEAHIIRAITPDGNHVLVLVGPRNFEPDENVEAQDSDVRDRFREGRFTDIAILGEPRIFRADLDDDHYIFALSADQMMRFGVQTGGLTGDTQTGQTGTQTGTDMGQTDTETGAQAGLTGEDADAYDATRQRGTEGADTETGTAMGETDTGTDIETGTAMGETDTETDTAGAVTGGEPRTTMSEDESEAETAMEDTGTETGTTGVQESETGQVGRALSEPDAGAMVSHLEEAGLEDASEIQGRLVKAMTEDGAPVFFVITRKDMGSDAEVDVSEQEVREKLEQGNLKDVQFIDKANIVRGNLEDDHVFVLAGDLFGQGRRQ